MGKTLELGRRIELHSMDPHCHDISLGLYRLEVNGSPRFLVHSYSSLEGTRERMDFIREALLVVVGMEAADSLVSSEGTRGDGWIQFPCKSDHERALKRAFLDICKLSTGTVLANKPLTVFDRKANGEISAVNLGSGIYELRAEGGVASKRATAVARGFAKLCEMDFVAGTDSIRFPCEIGHDALVGMLMTRAQNVRGTMKEGDMAASRGVLSAPSQQK